MTEKKLQIGECVKIEVLWEECPPLVIGEIIPASEAHPEYNGFTSTEEGTLVPAVPEKAYCWYVHHGEIVFIKLPTGILYKCPTTKGPSDIDIGQPIGP